MAFDTKGALLPIRGYLDTCKRIFKTSLESLNTVGVQAGILCVLSTMLLTLCATIFISNTDSSVNLNAPKVTDTRTTPDTEVDLSRATLLSSESEQPESLEPQISNWSASTDKAAPQSMPEKEDYTPDITNIISKITAAYEDQSISPELIAESYAALENNVHLSRLDAVIISYAALDSVAYKRSLANVQRNIDHPNPEVRRSAIKSHINYGLEYGEPESLEFIYQLYTQETNDQVKQLLLEELAFSGNKAAIEFVEHQAENPNNSTYLQEASWIALANSTEAENE